MIIMGIQQSTGQTAAHCGSSLKTLHSIFLEQVIYVRNRRLRFIRIFQFHPVKQLFPVSLVPSLYLNHQLLHKLLYLGTLVLYYIRQLLLLHILFYLV
jgi:hypothetical protein